MMKPTKAIIPITALAVFMTACSQQEEPDQVKSQNADDNTAQKQDLSALSEEDVRNVSLQGELGCSFTTTSESVLLIAMGVVASSDPAEGLIKLDNELQSVSTPGGFDGMMRGATFEGDSNAVQVSITGEPQGSGESPPYPAELMIVDSDQPAIKGLWTCGP